MRYRVFLWLGVCLRGVSFTAQYFLYEGFPMHDVQRAEGAVVGVCLYVFGLSALNAALRPVSLLRFRKKTTIKQVVEPRVCCCIFFVVHTPSDFAVGIFCMYLALHSALNSALYGGHRGLTMILTCFFKGFPSRWGKPR